MSDDLVVPDDLVAPTYSEIELLEEVATQAFIVAHYLLQRSRSEVEERAARALILFVQSEVKPLLMDSELLPNICPECFTNLDDVGIFATSDAHRAHLTDEENQALNEAFAESWKNAR